MRRRPLQAPCWHSWCLAPRTFLLARPLSVLRRTDQGLPVSRRPAEPDEHSPRRVSERVAFLLAYLADRCRGWIDRPLARADRATTLRRRCRRGDRHARFDGRRRSDAGKGLGLLEYQHLFHPFFTPPLLAVAAMLTPRSSYEDDTRQTLGLRFLVKGDVSGDSPALAIRRNAEPDAACAGARLAAWRERRAHIVCDRHARPSGGLVVATLASGHLDGCARGVRPRQRAQRPGLPNRQPYAGGERCSFRRDFFSALVEADELFSHFDPENHAVAPFRRALRSAAIRRQGLVHATALGHGRARSSAR